MKRHYRSIIVAISLILLTLSITPALALAAFPDSGQVQTGARAEVTEWKYARIDGVLHKRLWSITYNRWLTDWIPC